MATYDRTANLGVGIPLRGLKVYTIENEVDLNLAGANGAAAPVASDVIKVLRIPKGSLLLNAGCIPKRVAAGTSLVITMNATSGKGVSINSTSGSTATLINSSTPMAVGTIAPVVVSTAGITGKTSSTEDEDVYITATMTTVTAVTDFGKQKFYAVIAKID